MKLTQQYILSVVLREMEAYATAWRESWHDFDGRILQSQLRNLAAWAADAVTGTADPDDYTKGTAFLEQRRCENDLIANK